MATIVNTPAHEHVHEDSHTNSGLNLLMGVIVVLALVFLLFYFGLPIIRNAGVGTAPQVNVPDKINVDVNAPNAPAPQQ